MQTCKNSTIFQLTSVVLMSYKKVWKYTKMEMRRVNRKRSQQLMKYTLHILRVGFWGRWVICIGNNILVSVRILNYLYKKIRRLLIYIIDLFYTRTFSYVALIPLNDWIQCGADICLTITATDRNTTKQ